MANVVAERVVERLKAAGFVVMQKPPAGLLKDGVGSDVIGLSL
jgi:hypothetical protein